MKKLKKLLAIALMMMVLGASAPVVLADGPGETPGVTGPGETPGKTDEGPGETPGRLTLEIIITLATSFVA
ncbi:MAG: hypothetical protein H7Y30_12730 [Pyrinomonadaceae bacterium]|nr:hypothetical protein [Pyrinomonadaceae bacterium]